MLKELRIQNIILMEKADIPFHTGLNILSGETGSGKSAIMNALSLASGERADASIIRKNADKGTVEAVFDIDQIPSIAKLLEESGIDFTPGEELFIRREISNAGKSRAFINNQMAQQGLLKKVCGFLFNIVGQHANQQLLSTEAHREILDVYGDLKKDVSQFALDWTKENQKRSELDTLTKSESQRLREIEVCERELEELQEAQLKEGEEETLFTEYTLLSNSEELSRKSHEIYDALTGEKQSILLALNKQKNTFDQLARLDPTLKDAANGYHDALLELQESTHTLRNYIAHIEHQPERIEEVNERLTLITKLKRKYGHSIEEITAYQTATEEKLIILQNADAKIEELQSDIDILAKQNNLSSQQLTQKRQDAALKLEKAIVQQLRALNMPKAEFHCVISSQSRNRYGNDLIEFFLSPNLGEQRIPVKECASGGELSRLMLAIQVLLAGKGGIPTLIFDEIDGNIGGQTAVVVGEKLKEIGSQHQVLCITHFSQVAVHGNHHLQILKVEKEGRTVSCIKTLDKKSRQQELARMQGIL